MRQKDLDQLHDIVEKELEHVDAVELPGMELVVGQVIKSVSYSNNGALDFTAMRALLERLKEMQRT